MNGMNKRLIERIGERNWDRFVTGNNLRARAQKCLKILGDVDTELWDQDKLVDTLRCEGLQDSTINRYLSTMDSLDYPVNYLRLDQKEPRVLCSEELEQLDLNVRGYQGEAWEDDYKAVYGVLRDTGCRGIAELSRFKWDKVDWEGRTCVLTSYKGGTRDRTVPLTESAMHSLSWLAYTRPDLCRHRWARFWRKIRLDHDNRPYDLRHTYCTRLLDAGVAPQTVCQIMGHTDLKMTMHYYHTTPKTLADAARAIS